MSPDKEDPKGRPDLDLEFTFRVTDEMKRIDVSKKGVFTTRLKNAAPSFQVDVRNAQNHLVLLKSREKTLALKKIAARKTGDTKKEQKIDRQITQNKRMIDSRTLEMQLCYYVGKKGQSLDAVNPYSKSGVGRTDIVTDKLIIECTIGKHKKRSRQLEDHVRLGKATNKDVLLAATPNLGRDAATHAIRKGVEPAASMEKTHDAVKKRYSANEKDSPKQSDGTREHKERKSIKDLLQDKPQSQTYGQARFEKIYDRQYAAAQNRGANDPQARQAALDRVRHVATKMELLKERADLREAKIPRLVHKIEPHFQKDAAFRSERVKDLKQQAQSEGRPYKGPTEKPEGLRKVEAHIQAREFWMPQNLNYWAEKQSWTPEHYDKQVVSTTKDMERRRDRDLGTYFEGDHALARSYGHEISGEQNRSATQTQSMSRSRGR